MLYIVKHIIAGFYHMWYIRMIISLYLLIPVLNIIYERKPLFIYLLALIILNTNMISVYMTYITNDSIIDYLHSFNFAFKPSYLGYFMLGPILRDLTIKDIYKKHICILSLLLIALSTVSKIESSFNVSSIINIILGGVETFSLSRIIFCASTFTLFRIINNNSLSQYITKYLFGIYLIHPIFISQFFTSILKLPTIRTQYTLIDILFNILIIFFFSLISSFIGTKVPFINQHMFLNKNKSNS